MARSLSSEKPRIFVDSDVLFAGSASPSEHSASQVILRMAEITLIEAICTEQVPTEVRRNLEAKLPDALPGFELLADRCLDARANPAQGEVEQHAGKADAKDLPLLVAAVRERCPFLVTFNTSDFEPGHPNVEVLRPGALLRRVRDVLARL